MEQNQQSPQIPYVCRPASPISYVYPPQHHDIMAASYAQSLTSSPYYYFIPHNTYASGYYYIHPHYAYGLPRYGVPTIISPNFEPPTNSVQYSSTSPDKIIDEYENYQRFQVTDPCRAQVGDQGEGLVEEVKEKDTKSIDPRIINILEPFRELYSEQEDSLKSIFPGIYSKLSEFFKKVNSLVLEAINANDEGSKPPKSMKRSLSLGSTSCNNEWFKVRPIDSEETVIVPPEGKKGDDQQTD